MQIPALTITQPHATLIAIKGYGNGTCRKGWKCD